MISRTDPVIIHCADFFAFKQFYFLFLCHISVIFVVIGPLFRLSSANIVKMLKKSK